jgi:hypothetical protein
LVGYVCAVAAGTLARSTIETSSLSARIVVGGSGGSD